jgi:hypothetical protein
MIVPYWIVLLVLPAFASSHWGLERRMRRVESAIDRLSRHVGALPPLATEPSQRVNDLVVMPGKKVEAIRALSEEMGSNFNEATKIVASLKTKAMRGRP